MLSSDIFLTVCRCERKIMIYDELKNLITMVRADDTVDIFDEAVKLFDAMNQDNYMDIFEATVSSSPNLTDDQLITELLNDLNLLLDNIFSIQGVKLIDEVLISDKIKIARGLIAIFDYSDKTSMARVIETDLNPEEKLSELLNMVTDIPTEECFSLLAEVNPAVPTRIGELILEEATETMQAVYNDLMKSIVESYIVFKERLLDKKPFYTDKYFKDAQTIGLDYKYYLDELLQADEFKDLLAKMDNLGKVSDDAVYDEVSKYMIAVYLLSVHEQTNPIQVIRDHMNLVTSNVDSLTKLETSVSKNLIKLTSTGVVNE